MDCKTAYHEARTRCRGKRGDEYEACFLGAHLRTWSLNLQDEVVCQSDGFTQVRYLSYKGGEGQVQKVPGMQMFGQPSRFTGA